MRGETELDIGVPPTRPSPSPISQSRVRHAIANAYQLRGQGRYREAVDAMRLAASFDPNNAHILHDLALTCLNAGLPADAVAALSRAINIKPEFAQAFCRLGQALLECGQVDGAIVALRKATELQPGLTDAQYNRAAARAARQA